MKTLETFLQIEKENSSLGNRNQKQKINTKQITKDKNAFTRPS